MHFSKTYQQLLLTLPPELRDSAIEYRKLKKLINQVVTELTSLGLAPEVLHDVLQPGGAEFTAPRTIKVNEQEVEVIYELRRVEDHIEPRLRLRIESHDQPVDGSPAGTAGISAPGDGLEVGDDRITSTMEFGVGPDGVEYTDESILISPGVAEAASSANSPPDAHEVVIPLASDSAFYQLLTQALQILSSRLTAVRLDFESKLHALSRSISFAARPMSATQSFRAHSAHATHPSAIEVQTPSHIPFAASKSDLYAWREIFQLYMDTEIFESHAEASRGERTIEEAEARMARFLEQLESRGLASGRRFTVRESRDALQMFLSLNAFILDLRKFQHATAEATRKILKKHAKRTALPLPPALASPFMVPDGANPRTFSIVLPPAGGPSALVPRSTVSLSHLLGQALGETILPIIPHIDDYACLICTNIAFKPIRLSCGHLFCVRCLVKMQKRGQDQCPMCRALTVVSANRSNVDWAMLNFMKDWFPIESKQKLRQNEREVAEEELEELGIDNPNCIVM
ncbi:SPX domain-containing protein [Fomitopsis serialis]|uniref:SPX domain-containing protein n=1 Tax=Fomitopsis serialis TaxID=139415 RepID=UPI00200890F7|nr:SPX domain-containing protein [Neoantrodia serialis]KAH9929159.1 SPX domain-containing protein [Neoantrodia serialis]